MVNGGDTFWIPDAGGGHLYVVLSEPHLDADHVILVSITSHKSYKDQACILETGFHPSITRRSCVDYRRALVYPVNRIEQLVTSRQIAPKEQIPSELLKCMRLAAPESRISLKNLKILTDQGLIEQ